MKKQLWTLCFLRCCSTDL